VNDARYARSLDEELSALPLKPRKTSLLIAAALVLAFVGLVSSAFVAGSSRTVSDRVTQQ
jgi:hypothetical protein